MNISKNNISYFVAGYKACLLANEIMSAEEIERLDYTTLDFGNYIRGFLRAYESEQFNDESLMAMYKEIKSVLATEDKKLIA